MKNGFYYRKKKIGELPKDYNPENLTPKTKLKIKRNGKGLK